MQYKLKRIKKVYPWFKYLGDEENFRINQEK